MVEINRTKYTEIGRRVRALPPEKNTPNHRWEELVYNLCQSNDARLRAIGKYELRALREKFPNCILFKAN